MISAIEVFERNAYRYDSWYIKHWYAYQSELMAIQSIMPPFNNGIEIGSGTGRFAIPLKINVGVEPANAMADIALQRGLNTVRATAEKLPFSNESFDLALIVVSICFFLNPHIALLEVNRILGSSGHLILGIIPADSLVGNFYLRNKIPPFYAHAKFFTVKDIVRLLKKANFTTEIVVQTLFDFPWMLKQEDPTVKGFGKGSFVAILAQKI